jgi:hypothetical protein
LQNCNLDRDERPLTLGEQRNLGKDNTELATGTLLTQLNNETIEKIVLQCCGFNNTGCWVWGVGGRENLEYWDKEARKAGMVE